MSTPQSRSPRARSRPRPERRRWGRARRRRRPVNVHGSRFCRSWRGRRVAATTTICAACGRRCWSA
eukprot:874667-Pleurochrysis_carterae.AAC.1